MRALLGPAMATAIAAVAAGACTTKHPQPSTFFDRTISPVLQTSCVRTNTGAGCHVADDGGNAFGNLDLTAYAGVDRRRDLLLDYGPYGQPSLLVKNVPPYQVTVQTWDGTKTIVTTDVKHVGGPILDPTASAYQTLRRWIENGATENDTGIAPVVIPKTQCSDYVPNAPGFDPASDPSALDFATFRDVAAPALASACAAGNCHGTSANALYLTCGTSPPETRWNYFAAVQYLAATPEQSEMLRRPLATSQGGSYHEGGPTFPTTQDDGYQAILKWAREHGPVSTPALDPALLFFARRVQPVLARKGCMMAQCHSAGMFHDYRLRGGSAGSFSLAASQRNYALSLSQLSLESDDVGASRLVRKNLHRPEVFAGSPGIAHRGGPLLEDFGDQRPSGALCDQGKYDYDKGDLDAIPAYCVIREWHARERAARKLAPLSAVVYVRRAPAPGRDRPQDFDVFAGGASLHVAQATLSSAGDVTLSGPDVAVDLSACGLGSSPDVKRPAVSWDKKTIAFAARASASSPLAVYTIASDGTGCAKHPLSNHDATGNGLLEHDFDPAFAPDGTIVFASTRGNLDSSGFDYSGPQRTPEDTSKPNANLYAWDPVKKAPRQLTWQLDLERLPSFMQDGRVVFTAEKREPGFYQLALRRQNLDGGDYHPLYAQRASIGYRQATYVVELADKDFAAIFSNQDATHMGGALAVFNRSIGIDFASGDAKDYLVDRGVPSVEPQFFLHSLRVVASDGVYTSPASLPEGKMLVSWASGDAASFGGDYDLYVFDPTTGQKTKLLGDAGTAEVEAVAVYERANRGVFASTPEEPNGHTLVHPGESAADIMVADMRVLASLLFQNTPTGRVVEPALPAFDVYEELPPDVASGDCGGNTATDDFGKVCVRRRLAGTVPLEKDGSAHFRVPGGLPMLLHLQDDDVSRSMNLPRWQREAMTFVPGEYVHQSFRSVFFDGFCAGCHGAISGRPVDAALKPDFLTQASMVDAVGSAPWDLTDRSKYGAVEGPPQGP